MYQVIKQLKEKRHNDNLKLRVTVDSGGCSGYKYGFELAENLNEDDVYVYLAEK